MSTSNLPLSAGSGREDDKFIKFRRVRAGWYRARAVRRNTGKEMWIHIVRASERHPRWGWDVRAGDDEYEVPPRMTAYTIESGLIDLVEAELAAERLFKRLPSSDKGAK